MNIEVRYRTPPQLAKELGVNADRVRGWIQRGELEAVNLSDSLLRPRWRISDEAVEAFLRSRSNSKPELKPRRRRRLANVTEYF